MNDRTLVLGALTWSVGILVVAYLYRVTITDPHFAKTQQLVPIVTASESAANH